MSSLMSEPDIMFKKCVAPSSSFSNSIKYLFHKSDPCTSTKTLFYQSGLHPDELGNVGGYDTKETREYELSGQYFTEQDTNADTGWTSGLNHWIILYILIQFLSVDDYGIGANSVFSIYNSFMISHFASFRKCRCSNLC